MGRAVALVFILASAKVGEAFLLTGPRIASASRQRRCQHEHVASNDIPGTCRPLVGPLTITSMTAADASTQQQQQQQQLPLATELLSAKEGDKSEGLGGATKPAAPEHVSRMGITVDGTPLEFKRPSTQDLHKLDMGEWVARKSVSLALVALNGERTTEEGSTMGNAPLAGSVVEVVAGSSVATMVCLLRHSRMVGVSEAVEHALLDETITQFLNEGSRLSQVGYLQVTLA